MIAKPTTPQLINAACTELVERVTPTVTEPTARVVLDMAVAVLKGAAVRAANEQAWMREEADAIEAVAVGFTDESSVADALRAYTTDRTDSLYLADVQADYERASELLSRCAEAAYASGDPDLIAAVTTLLDQRMANERAVIGQFVAAGRTE